MYTPKSIKDGSAKSEVVSSFPTAQDSEWKHINPSKENQATVLREKEIGAGKRTTHVWDMFQSNYKLQAQIMYKS